jgi:hypothetical protein
MPQLPLKWVALASPQTVNSLAHMISSSVKCSDLGSYFDWEQPPLANFLKYAHSPWNRVPIHLPMLQLPLKYHALASPQTVITLTCK